MYYIRMLKQPIRAGDRYYIFKRDENYKSERIY